MDSTSNVARLRTRPLVVAAAICCVFLLGTLWAEIGNVENTVPRPLNPEDFQDVLKHSPFTRSLNLPKTLVLTGVAVVDENPIATVIDIEAGRAMVISDTPNELGWKLVELQRMDDLDGAVAIIAMESGETVRAYHDKKLIKTAKLKVRFGAGFQAQQLGAEFLPDWVHEMEDPVLKGIAIQKFIEGGAFDAAPFEAVAMALAVPEPQARGPAVSAAFGRLGGGVGGTDIKDAVNRLNAIPVGRDRDFAINGLAHGLVGRDPDGALKWANSISNDGFRDVVVRNVSRRIEARSRR